ncbi:protein serine/threonine phosphatase [Crinalium epipsammum PCC 9333]|uniref:Protein serine/threonine phosphatase n=1 Tax=Crinalium epipsammum PCC 9333 TaxID=1173022 RepID=K9W432_9CYAN|nr:protein phosphatase 2C domain-containing protein [Crinalium epipsammum]AFZ14512.1 protein serine/threonine phosphatase [Crinalium epipsammum PCC 9333]
MQPDYIVRSEINQRENNEDSFQIFSIISGLTPSPIIILAIADGMGGLAYGEQVSREGLKKLSLALFEELVVEPSINRLEAASGLDTKILSQAVMNAIEQANAHVRRVVEVNKWGKAGSTIVIAAILQDKAIVGNLGDSPLFHYQVSSGKLTKITEDHTVAAVLMQMGMLTPEMARYHEGRNQLEFYLGCYHLPQNSPLYELDLVEGDLLLLCSDGINGCLLHKEIEAIFAENKGYLAKLADNLIIAAKAAGETDNQTLILWKCQGGGKVRLSVDTVVQSGETTRQILE